MIRIAGIIAGVAALAACTTMGEGGSPQPSLAGTTWRLAELGAPTDNVDKAKPADPALYELSFGADGQAAIRLHCNTGNIGFTTKPEAGGIMFKQAAVTRRFCPGGSLDVRVARELPFVRTYAVDGDRLILMLLGDGGAQVWTRKP